jgi:putative membrane protein
VKTGKAAEWHFAGAEGAAEFAGLYRMQNRHSAAEGTISMAIRNFRDHAANERTFLAWVRTSIAVIAFGFLVERFDLFLAIASSSALESHISTRRSDFGQLAGMILILSGVAMVVLATMRFLKTAKELDDPDVLPGTGSRLDVALTALIVVLGVALVFYLSHAVTAKA